VASGRGEYTILGSAADTENLLRPLQLAGPRADTQTLEQCNIEL